MKYIATVSFKKPRNELLLVVTVSTTNIWSATKAVWQKIATYGIYFCFY